MSGNRENFGSRAAVIMAMAGSAIGLGNIWRFPYMVGEHGGAVFLILYLIATVLISLPVFIAEITLGRRSRQGAYSALSTLDPGRRIWKFTGILSIIVPLLIASYYSVIGGWSVDFLLRSCTASFIKADTETVTSTFSTMVSSGWEPVVMHLLFLAVCSFVVALGVKSGIEKFSKISIPALFVLIILIIAYSLTLPGSERGIKYLVEPDFSQINTKTMAYALGQSFYSLSLGMGAIITYGSYVKKEEDIIVSGIGTAISDLVFALLAGFAIMPAVFAAGIKPDAGAGLIFQSLPYIFSSMGEQMPLLSAIASLVFFIAVVVAAMTSCISLIEVGVTFLIDRFNLSRKFSCFIIFLLCSALGVVCALSSNVLDGLDFLCSNIMLLILALFFVVFVGFVLKKEDVLDEVSNGAMLKKNVRLFNLIYFQIKWIAPIAILAILVTNFIF